MQIKKKRKKIHVAALKVSAITDQSVGASLEIRLIDFTHTKVKLFFFCCCFFCSCVFSFLSSFILFILSFSCKNLQATILFVNFTKAFDSIYRGNME